MRTVHIGAQGAIGLRVQCAGCELKLAGRSGQMGVEAAWGYFRDREELPSGDELQPESRVEGEWVVVRQTPEQVEFAERTGAKIRLEITAPAAFRVDAMLVSATVEAAGFADCRVGVRAGTVRLKNCTGRVETVASSGTLQVSGLAPGRHRFQVESGSIDLFAGSLLPWVAAEVRQGTIQGKIAGRLERLGMTGWVLVPLQENPEVSVACSVGSGVLTLRG